MILVIIIFIIIVIYVISCQSNSDGKNDEYQTLLNDYRWSRKRDVILKRDKNQCCYCHRKDNLQVHHKYYSKINIGKGKSKMVEPWNYPDEALITLCDACHKKEHERKTIKTYWRKRNENY